MAKSQQNWRERANEYTPKTNLTGGRQAREKPRDQIGSG